MAVFLTGPFLLAAVASMAGGYPFRGRLVLFLTPLLYLLCTKGLMSILKGRGTFLQAAGLILLAVGFLKQAPALLTERITRHEIRPVIVEMVKRRKAGDAVYICHGAGSPMQAYALMMDLPSGNWRFGVNPEKEGAFREDIRALREYPRVWIVFTHLQGGKSRGCPLPDMKGALLEGIHASGAGAYLYAF